MPGTRWPPCLPPPSPPSPWPEQRVAAGQGGQGEAVEQVTENCLVAGPRRQWEAGPQALSRLLPHETYKTQIQKENY